MMQGEGEGDIFPKKVNGERGDKLLWFLL